MGKNKNSNELTNSQIMKRMINEAAVSIGMQDKAIRDLGKELGFNEHQMEVVYLQEGGKHLTAFIITIMKNYAALIGFEISLSQVIVLAILIIGYMMERVERSGIAIPDQFASDTALLVEAGLDGIVSKIEEAKKNGDFNKDISPIIRA